MKYFVAEKPKDANGRFASANLPSDANNASRLSEELRRILMVRDSLLSILPCQINSLKVCNCCTSINQVIFVTSDTLKL